MKKFYFRNILMGMGMGTVLTSLIFIIYSAGISDSQISKEEVMERAKQYGMVLSSEVFSIPNEDGSMESKPDSKALAEEGKDGNDVTEEKEDELTKEIKVKIPPGSTSKIVAEDLFRKGLVDSAESFEALLYKMGLEGCIQIGEFAITRESEPGEIARVICGL
ncbi:MAG: endolytic transglycosylase MltG [Clostridium sp.]|nr:endolytic transglycosylase MltG [Clostridium sp.]